MRYTYSKFTEATEFLNAADPEPWEGISSVDTPHRLSVNGIWEVPVGRGRKFGTDVNGVVSAFISGWQFSGIYTYQSGFPIGFGNIIFTGDFDDIPLPGERAEPGARGSTPTPASTRSRPSSSDPTSGPSRCGSRTCAPTP